MFQVDVARWLLPLVALAALAVGDGNALRAQDDARSVEPTAAELQAAKRWDTATTELAQRSAAAGSARGGVVFVGSSSIRLWDLERWFPALGAVNHGFGGSQIADSLVYIDRLVTPLEPRAVVFYAGDNDIAAGKSAERVIEDAERFFASLWQSLPECRVVNVGIKPSLARWELIEPMRAVNRAIARLARAERRLSYVDVDGPMLGEDGRPRAELLVRDGLHLSESGYRLWSALVHPLIPDTVPAAPLFESELVFAPESWHNHGSSLVQLANGELVVAWFHGSGERRADDVAILGARRPLVPTDGSSRWTEPFVLADTPEFPDTNPTLLVDRSDRLWLFWPTILANTWESALMKYRVADDPAGEGAPAWTRSRVLHMKPGEGFEQAVISKTEELLASQGIERDSTAPAARRALQWAERNRVMAADKLTRRLGWFTRAHPLILDSGRILLGLYSDGFSISMATYSDDDGETWTMSEPIMSGGGVQPSFAQRADGSVLAIMRDNGPPPKRVQVAESRDRGATWTVARDHDQLFDPGAGNEIVRLRSGRFLVVHNHTESGRHRLIASLSDDEGETFRWRRAIEESEPDVGRFHYPSVVQTIDGSIHVSYSYHVNGLLEDGGQGKAIKHAWFNEAWLLAAAD